MPERDRPYVNGNFRVKIGDESGDSVVAGFMEVILPKAEAEVIEYRNGNEKENRPRKIPGNYRFENVVLRRGLIGADNLYQWWEQVRNGKVVDQLRDVVIELRDESGENVVCQWRLTNAWPAAISFSTLEASGEEIVMEIVELAYEDMDMEFG
jgi:phage tail-like protein